jgi:hypothetical protein
VNVKNLQKHVSSLSKLTRPPQACGVTLQQCILFTSTAILYFPFSFAINSSTICYGKECNVPNDLKLQQYLCTVQVYNEVGREVLIHANPTTGYTLPLTGDNLLLIIAQSHPALKLKFLMYSPLHGWRHVALEKDKCAEQNNNQLSKRTESFKLLNEYYTDESSILHH